MAEIQLEKTALGLDAGSTLHQSGALGPEHAVLASGAHDWENRLEHGYWTYARMTYGRACRMHLPGWPGRFRSGTARRCIPWAQWVFPV